MARTAPTSAPDYLTVPAWAELAADAFAHYADHLEKVGVEIGQQRLMQTQVRLCRRAEKLTRPYAEDED
jgi:hypothetical protein